MKKNKKLKCPVCGCKMKQDICPYCLVTSDEVRAASNKDAKIAMKAGKKEYIHYTNTLPSDVSRKKLFWFSLFLGWAGVPNFMVGKYNKGWFCLITSLLSWFFSAFWALSGGLGWSTTVVTIFTWGLEIMVFPFIVMLFFWLSDFMGVVSGSFKVPIIVAGKENK